MASTPSSARAAPPTADGSAPVARDVRLLSTILGQVLVEQEGAWLLELVEEIRQAARAARSLGPADVAKAVARADENAQTLVLRAFGIYFQLANLAEQHHRLRRRREDAHDGNASRDSLEDAFAPARGRARRRARSGGRKARRCSSC